MTTKTVSPAVKIAVSAVRELRRAVSLHGPMASAHEGYAILLEELDELKEEVWKRHKNRQRMRAEAIQVAAMAMRFVMDVCDVEGK